VLGSGPWWWSGGRSSILPATRPFAPVGLAVDGHDAADDTAPPTPIWFGPRRLSPSSFPLARFASVCRRGERGGGGGGRRRRDGGVLACSASPSTLLQTASPRDRLLAQVGFPSLGSAGLGLAPYVGFLLI
jgi:hypothetical protein